MTFHDDEPIYLTESGQLAHNSIVRMLNDGLEIDEVANYLGLTELQVKIMLILGEYDVQD